MPSSLDKKKQVQYFEKLYCTDSANICLTSGTTKEISILETLTLKQVMLKLALKGHFFSGNMLNIPSGNGRLNGFFSGYFGRIDCVDACGPAIDAICRQKSHPFLWNVIGRYEQGWLQEFQFTFGVKYDMIWCNYGASYLTDSEMETFLQRACQHLSENGAIVFKEVVIDDSEENNYLEAQQRVLRTQNQYESLFKSLHTVLI
jgi:hypothetical protein